MPAIDRAARTTRVTYGTGLSGLRGNHAEAARQRELADSYQALHDAYRQREDVFAATMADRADRDQATV